MKLWMIRAGIGLSVLLLAAPALAQSQYKVVKYLGSTVRTFTAGGEPNGKRDVSTLPKTPVDVVEEKAGHPGVKLPDNSVVYLKASDIETTGAPSDCADLAVNAKSNGARLAASEVGVSHGMSGQAVRCYRK